MRYLKKALIAIFVLIFASTTIFTESECRIQQTSARLTLGVFAGGNWDVPNPKFYTLFDTAVGYGDGSGRFQKKFSNIIVEYRSGTQKKDYSEWFAQEILEDNTPDVFLILSEDFNTFASIGVLENLDNEIASDPDFDTSVFYSTALQAGEFNGKQYALPFETVPTMMFVNKTLLLNERIEIPENDWTWDDFKNICERVTKDTDGDGIVDQYGCYDFQWQNAVYANGGVIFDANGEDCFINSPNNIKAIQFTKQIQEISRNYQVTSKDFDEGNVAFRPFLFSDYRAYKPYPYSIKKFSNFEWDCITLPAGDQGGNASQLHTLLFGVSSKTKYKKEAWELIKFLTTDYQTQLDIFKYSTGVSIIKEVTKSHKASNILQKEMPDEENFIDMGLLSEVIENSVAAPRFKKYNAAMALANTEVTQIINDDMNVSGSLKNLQKELIEFLKE